MFRANNLRSNEWKLRYRIIGLGSENFSEKKLQGCIVDVCGAPIPRIPNNQFAIVCEDELFPFDFSTVAEAR